MTTIQAHSELMSISSPTIHTPSGKDPFPYILQVTSYNVTHISITNTTSLPL